MTLTLCHMLRRYDVRLVNPKEDMDLLQTFVAKPGEWIAYLNRGRHEAACI